MLVPFSLEKDCPKADKKSLQERQRNQAKAVCLLLHIFTLVHIFMLTFAEAWLYIPAARKSVDCDVFAPGTIAQMGDIYPESR